MDDFDYQATYYRVLATRDGYIFRTGEPEAIRSGTTVYKKPYYEFDSLKMIGTWLHLGDEILVLRVPEGALVEENSPFSQGGCMEFSATEVRPIAVISVAELMRHYDEAGVKPSQLHLVNRQFDGSFQLPRAGVDSLNLSHCTGTLDLSGVTRRLCLWYSQITPTPWPAQLQELAITNARELRSLPKAENISLSSAIVEDLYVPAGTTHFQMFDCIGRVDLSQVQKVLSVSKSDITVLRPPAHVDYLYLTDSHLRGLQALPPHKENYLRDYQLSAE